MKSRGSVGRQPVSERMQVLVLGTGVIGSVYAGRPLQAGHHVVLLTRDQRLADLCAHGLVLQDLQSGRQTQLTGGRSVRGQSNAGRALLDVRRPRRRGDRRAAGPARWPGTARGAGMTRVAWRMLTQHPMRAVATFVALLYGAAVLTACGVLLESALRYHGVPQRYGASAVVVAATELTIVQGRR